MKLDNEFTVPAPIEQAWNVLLDVERVAPCLPGAAIEGSEGDEYTGTMTIKIGPITSRYRGTVKIDETDEAAHRAVMGARARDARGGTAGATITSTMEEVEGGTRVRVETDMRVTGPVAQFGRGVMQDVSAKLMGRFADCLAETMTAAPAAVSATAAPTAEERPAPPPGPAGDSAEAAARARTAPEPKPAADVLDLGAAGREAVLKRIAPAAAVLAGLLALLAIRRRRR
jgi:carbon monoxide dehydrogenase subunit G